ncbi:GDSL-type esterase/lipase family protein [Salipaludibacillus daqingensis]|uniref:GDSL-type esterase/lipase family protein n=1 Tax=Salipaludibacillus daqingensis TaxID=3041001 RepID=UPI0024749195|nr:GDSL-type esterase/lipase family protein [Salipaludibacillus daqingensis]
MKILFRSFILLLALTFLFSPGVLAKNDQAKDSLLSLGDSIPYGYNLGNNNASPSKDAFPYLIGEETDMRVRNLAVPGWKTDDMLDALENEQKYRQAVRQADYITLNIGNNDLLQALFTAFELSGGDEGLFEFYLNQQLANSDIYGNLSKIVEEIRSLTDAPIVIYNIYNPFQLNEPLHYVALNLLPGINFGFQQTINGLNALFGDITIADANGVIGSQQAEYIIIDDIHPTKAGQRKLADAGISALQPYIQ